MNFIEETLEDVKGSRKMFGEHNVFCVSMWQVTFTKKL